MTLRLAQAEDERAARGAAALAHLLACLRNAVALMDEAMAKLRVIAGEPDV